MAARLPRLCRYPTTGHQVFFQARRFQTHSDCKSLSSRLETLAISDDGNRTFWKNASKESRKTCLLTTTKEQFYLHTNSASLVTRTKRWLPLTSQLPDGFQETMFYFPGMVTPAPDSLSLPSPAEAQVLKTVDVGLEILDPGVHKEIAEPSQVEDRSMWLTRNMLRIRRKKMNKHKLRKRRRRDAAKRRSVFMIREKKRAKKRAGIKKALIKKIQRILADNPKSDYPKRPYVIHRLQNW